MVTTTGSTADVRGARRRALAYARLAELREGVWMRPANVAVRLPDSLDGDVELMTARPPDAGSWPPGCGTWRRGRPRRRPAARLDALAPDGPEALAPGFELSAAVLRHLQADPLLPAELLPADWPGATPARHLRRLGRPLPGDAARLEPRRLSRLGRQPGAVSPAPGSVDPLSGWLVQQVERVGGAVVVHEEDAVAAWCDGQPEEVAAAVEGIDRDGVDLGPERG